MSIFNDTGIYVVRIHATEPMPVTLYHKHVDICARIDNTNVKVGKSNNMTARRRDYCKVFGEDRVEFIPIALVNPTQPAETAILRHLKVNRKRSPKGGMLDWLEDIQLETAIAEAYVALDNAGISYIPLRDP